MILYLVISMLTGIIVTLIMDEFENIAVEKKIRIELEREIRAAANSFKNSAKVSTSQQVTGFIKTFTASALNGKVVTINPDLENKPADRNHSFLFTYKEGDQKLDFYILKSYLNKELAILDTEELVVGLIVTIVVFGFIILYTEKKKQIAVFRQQFEEKHEEFKKVLEEHEAFALLGRMVATLAHELKTPLATISNLVQVLPTRIEDRKFTSRFVALTVEELTRIQQLINNLLAYGKEIEVKDEEWIDLLNLLKDIALKKSLHIEKSPFIEIYGDKFLLNLLFDNLLRNSKNENADTIRIMIRTSESPENPNTEILIEDNRKGFPADVGLATLLNPFVTFHSSGAGLGLYLAKQIITAHGGTIFLYRIDHGAGVKLTLPKKRIKLYEQE